MENPRDERTRFRITRVSAHSRWMRAALGVLIVTLALGCASSKVQGKRDFTRGKLMPRPSRVLVYDFRADLSRLERSERVEQREVVEIAREALGTQLVERLRKMGMMARRVGRDIEPNPDDVLIDGDFVDVDEGNAFTRNVIGFGAGSTEIVAHVEVLRKRPDNPKGAQLLFDFRAVSEGSHMPGIVAPIGLGSTAAVAVSGTAGVVGEIKGPVAEDAIRMADSIADDLAVWFVEQGWLPEEAIED